MAVHRKASFVKLQTLIQASILAVLGGIMWVLGHHIMPVVLWIVAALLLALPLVAPSVHSLLQQVIVRLARILSHTIALAALTLIFYTVFAAGALWLRMRRVDPLSREFPGQINSNWIARTGYPSEPSTYHKPFSHPHSGTEKERRSK